MRSNFDLYNVENPVKILINDYDDMDGYEDLNAIIIHTPIEDGNEMVAVYDPKRLTILKEDFPDFGVFDADIHYKLPMNQIKDTNPYVLLGVCKGVKLVWQDFNPASKLIDEINAKTSLRIVPQTEIALAQLVPPIIVPKVGDYLLLTDRTKMFEELEKLEDIIFSGDYEEERNCINIHFII